MRLKVSGMVIATGRGTVYGGTFQGIEMSEIREEVNATVTQLSLYCVKSWYLLGVNNFTVQTTSTKKRKYRILVP